MEGDGSARDFIADLKNKVCSVSDIAFLKNEALKTALDIFSSSFFEYTQLTSGTLNCLDKHSAASCGRVFEKGDVIYRCKDCTHDETCVLCSSCFQESDHVGHQINVSVSNGAGGSCDCGEEESWNRPLSCPVHRIIEPVSFSASQHQYLEPAKKFFEALLSYCEPYLTLKLDDLPIPERDGALVLFNDEKHSFDDVISVLIDSRVVAPLNIMKAHEIALLVDTHGFACIKLDQTDSLHWPMAKIRSIGLETLILEPALMNSLVFSYSFLKWISDFSERHTSVREQLMSTLIGTNSAPSFLKNVFAADRFLLKGTRSAITDILIRCGLADLSHKSEIGHIYGDAFPSMLSSYFNGLREPETSLVHFSVQLLTVSSVLSKLLSDGDFFTRLCSSITLYINESDWFSKKFITNFSIGTSVFRYIFKDPIFQQNHTDHLQHFQEFFEAIVAPFEMMNEQKRELHEHVEYESTEWTSAFTIHIILTEILYSLISSFDQMTCSSAIKFIISFPLNDCHSKSLHSIAVTALSILVRKLHGESIGIDDFRKSIISSFEDKYDAVFERAMCVLNFCSEIEMNLWVRNGDSMKSQAQLFRYSPYRLALYHACVAMVKIGLLVNDDVDEFFAKIDRFVGRSLELTEKNHQLGQLIINLIYGISFHPIDSEDTLREIVNAFLLAGPTTYSEFEGTLPFELLEQKAFDRMLMSHSNLSHCHDFGDGKFCGISGIQQRFCPFYWLYNPEIRERGIQNNSKSASLLQMLENIHYSSPISLKEFAMVPSLTSSKFLVGLSSRLLSSGLISTQDLGLSIMTLLLGKINHNSLNGLHLSAISLDQIFSRLGLEEASRQTDTSMASEAKRRALDRLKSHQSKFTLKTSAADSEDLILKSISKYPINGCCIICQEICGDDRPFGALAHLAPTVTIGSLASGIRLSACHHIIHMNCFKYLYGATCSGPCPVCSRAFNIYLPVLSDSYLTLRPEDTISTDIMEWIRSGGLDLSTRIHQTGSQETSGPLKEHLDYGHECIRRALTKLTESDSLISWLELLEGVVLQLKIIEDYGYDVNHHLSASRIFLRFISSCHDMNVSDDLDVEIREAYGTLVTLISADSTHLQCPDLSIVSLFVALLVPRRHQVSLQMIAHFFTLCCTIATVNFGSREITSYETLLQYVVKLRVCFENLPWPIDSDLTRFVIAKASKLHPIKIPTALSFELPERYDWLLVKLEASCCSRCSSKPPEPALCLLCGELLCARSLCCFEADKGECYAHISRCGLQGGVYLLLRKNALLILSSRFFRAGRLQNSPYVDIHGQNDMNLRRGKLLFLSKVRLDLLTKLWVTGGIDTYVLDEGNPISDRWRIF